MKSLCALYAVTAASCSALGELGELVAMTGCFSLASGGMVAMVEDWLKCYSVVYLHHRYGPDMSSKSVPITIIDARLGQVLLFLTMSASFRLPCCFLLAFSRSNTKRDCQSFGTLLFFTAVTSLPLKKLLCYFFFKCNPSLLDLPSKTSHFLTLFRCIRMKSFYPCL